MNVESVSLFDQGEVLEDGVCLQTLLSRVWANVDLVVRQCMCLFGHLHTHENGYGGTLHYLNEI